MRSTASGRQRPTVVRSPSEYPPQHGLIITRHESANERKLLPASVGRLPNHMVPHREGDGLVRSALALELRENLLAHVDRDAYVLAAEDPQPRGMHHPEKGD